MRSFVIGSAAGTAIALFIGIEPYKALIVGLFALLPFWVGYRAGLEDGRAPPTI